MNIETIIKLIDAGYSKAEIEAFNAPAETAENIAEVKPEVPAESQKEAEPVKVFNSNDDVVNSLIEEIRGLKKQMQMHSIINDGLNPKRETAEDILASIINPVEKGK